MSEQSLVQHVNYLFTRILATQISGTQLEIEERKRTGKFAGSQ